jgi:lysozyme
MKPSLFAVKLIKHFEGFESKAYICPAGKVTIGYGTTIYPNDKAVKLGDVCSEEEASGYLLNDITKRAALLGDFPVNQFQFDAIVSFAYNVGMGSWNISTLRKKVKSNPNDPSIREEFKKWNKARVKGKLVVLDGLTKRRKAEADLYFSSNPTT